MSRDMEHQFDALIPELIAQGWSCARIARHIGRSEAYVHFRVRIKDPLGPQARDPGRLTMERVFRRYPIAAHKPGGW